MQANRTHGIVMCTTNRKVPATPSSTNYIFNNFIEIYHVACSFHFRVEYFISYINICGCFTSFEKKNEFAAIERRKIEKNKIQKMHQRQQQRRFKRRDLSKISAMLFPLYFFFLFFSK